MKNTEVKSGEFLSTAEAAALLGCSLSTAQRRIRAGDLSAQLIGGAYVIKREDVEQLIEKDRTIENQSGSEESSDLD